MQWGTIVLFVLVTSAWCSTLRVVTHHWYSWWGCMVTYTTALYRHV